MSEIVAVFWDFEHLHYALMLEQHGQYGMKKAIGRPQPKTVSVEAVMDYARTFGQVLHSEAFGNWHWMSRYAQPLELEQTTLVQVFPQDQYKPADVFSSMVYRVKQYVEAHEDVTSIVLVGLNDDYVKLCEDLKALGCNLHAVGADEQRNKKLQSKCDDYVSYYDLPNAPPRPDQGRKAKSGTPAEIAKYYLRVAAQQGVRMPPPQMMWIGIDIYAAFLRDFGQFNNFKELDEECYDQLRQDVPEATMTEVKKIRQVLFKCYLFRPSEDGQISFQEHIKDLEAIENCYFDLMLRRIANNLNEEVNYQALSLALTGTENSAQRLETMHKDMEDQEE
ncbi:NYN domain-containing protein [Neolewinella persica]|uniref:NYN domain-containing protein n=1 Tax=Neolewinella persica TaxID=70998 RepID=UPI00036EBE66|nr:NYN domain-containing protein [Neolewinella persica]